MGARRAILISGFYGFGNIGDEAVLAGMIRSLRARLGSVPLIVLSSSPAATVGAHNVHAVPRGDPRAVWAALRRARLFLSGGGSLIQDITSARSALYYLGLLRLAQTAGVRSMVYAAGLGPLRRPLIRRLARHVLARTDVLAVRDRNSALLLPALGVHRSVVLTADPAFLMELPAAPPSGPPAVGVVVRPWEDEDYLAPLAAALGRVASRRGAQVFVIPFHPAMDMSLSRRMAAACGGTVVEDGLGPSGAFARLAGCQVVVGMRLHALLFAAMAGVPLVGLAYDPKVTALYGDLGVGEPLPLQSDPSALAAAIEFAWDQRATLRSVLLAAVERLRERANIAADEAARLYSAV